MVGEHRPRGAWRCSYEHVFPNPADEFSRLQQRVAGGVQEIKRLCKLSGVGELYVVERGMTFDP